MVWHLSHGFGGNADLHLGDFHAYSHLAKLSTRTTFQQTWQASAISAFWSSLLPVVRATTAGSFLISTKRIARSTVRQPLSIRWAVGPFWRHLNREVNKVAHGRGLCGARQGAGATSLMFTFRPFRTGPFWSQFFDLFLEFYCPRICRSCSNFGNRDVMRYLRLARTPRTWKEKLER